MSQAKTLEWIQCYKDGWICQKLCVLESFQPVKVMNQYLKCITWCKMMEDWLFMKSMYPSQICYTAADSREKHFSLTSDLLEYVETSRDILNNTMIGDAILVYNYDLWKNVVISQWGSLYGWYSKPKVTMKITVLYFGTCWLCSLIMRVFCTINILKEIRLITNIFTDTC